mmetsp:Transcript_17081/g.37058  ORF Transcript_17081/g.37058 Transcript_17081/m.37058 type:complete len:166 (+) Transcript_17081:1126-1623(+)
MTTMNTIAQVNHAQLKPTAAVDMDHVALDLSIATFIRFGKMAVRRQIHLGQRNRQRPGQRTLLPLLLFQRQQDRQNPLSKRFLHSPGRLCRKSRGKHLSDVRALFHLKTNAQSQTNQRLMKQTKLKSPVLAPKKQYQAGTTFRVKDTWKSGPEAGWQAMSSAMVP